MVKKTDTTKTVAAKKAASKASKSIDEALTTADAVETEASTAPAKKAAKK
ncbi:MAG: hypothetical protein GX844_02865, partial [Alcaligenaceae bacterium]|nr:hypothetical protein [Alcaligenaceae bacterium]